MRAAAWTAITDALSLGSYLTSSKVAFSPTGRRGLRARPSRPSQTCKKWICFFFK